MKTPHTAADEEFRAACRASARRLVELAAASGIRGPATFTETAEGRVVAIALLPDLPAPADRPTPLTECELAIVTVIATLAPRRLKAREILKEMDRRGQIFGESTVAHTLAKLVRQGVLLSAAPGAPGYTFAPTRKRTAERFLDLLARPAVTDQELSEALEEVRS